MTHKIAVSGLALVAVFAMSAMGASAAQAAGTFTWSAGTTELTAEADPTTPSRIFTFTTKTGAKNSLTCNEVSAEGNVSGSSATEITAQNVVFADSATTPKTNRCTAKIGEAESELEVSLNGCDLRLAAGTTVSETTTEGTADIVCPAGKEIEVTMAGCSLKVPGQEGLGPIFYHTVKAGTKKEITAEALINTEPKSEHNKGITYTTEGIICGKQVEGKDRNDGALTGTVTVKGYSGLPHDAAHQTDVTVE